MTYDEKYTLTKIVYMEARNAKYGHALGIITDFHMTPGPGFMEATVFDLVQELLAVDESVLRGDLKPLTFEQMEAMGL